MSLIKKFKAYQQKKSVSQAEKYGETLKNLMTTKEQRLEAIELLAKTSPEIAVPQLLKRFELVVDHGIQDVREKEMICEIIIKHKDISRDFVQNSLQHSRRISWPIKLSEKIFAKEDFLEILLQNLKTDFIEFDEITLDRNIEILLSLKEHRSPKILEKVLSLLKSRDEGVKMAAIECLEAQGDTYENARHALISLLAEPATDDNSRMLGLIRSIVQKHAWQ